MKNKQSLARWRSLRMLARSVASLLAKVTVLHDDERRRRFDARHGSGSGLLGLVRNGGSVEEAVEAVSAGFTFAACVISPAALPQHLSSILISLSVCVEVPKMTPPRCPKS